MTTRTLFVPSLTFTGLRISRAFAIFGATAVQDDRAPEADRARRAFVDDMLTRNPEAFSSELDVQGMMHLYPGRF